MIDTIIDAVSHETKKFFTQFNKIDFKEIEILEQETIEFQPYTVLIGTGGADNTLFAISCQAKLLDHLIKSFGFANIENEKEKYREGTAYEVANMIIGGSLDKFHNSNEVTLTVPLLIGEASKIVKYERSILYTLIVKTDKGNLVIDIIQPKELVTQSKHLIDG